jgi:hypothetical protein
LKEDEKIEAEGYSWNALDRGGVLTVRRFKGNTVIILQ